MGNLVKDEMYNIYRQWASTLAILWGQVVFLPFLCTKGLVASRSSLPDIFLM